MCTTTLMLGIICSLLTLSTHSGLAHREHKVHNIVLYPDKESWCKTTAIKQIVTSPGYKQTVIDNNVCVGACFSYSIPRTQPSEPGEFILPYCDSCQPLTTRCYHVTLQADEKNADVPKTIQKRVQIITNCTCTSCDKPKSNDCELIDAHTIELPTDLFSDLNVENNNGTTQQQQQQQHETPELLEFQPSNNKTRNRIQYVDENDNNVSSNLTTERRFELNTKLIALLKSIQEQDEEDEGEEEKSTNFNYDREQLRDLLTMIEGSQHQALNDRNLMEFVNFVNVHNSQDLELDVSRLKEILTDFKQTQDLAEKHRQFGLGGPKHYVGEEQRIQSRNVLGHLVYGPHGSLVLEEETPKVEEKLNIEPHLLKPNHVGTELSYENHNKRHVLV